jgi:hypothetical protein
MTSMIPDYGPLVPVREALSRRIGHRHRANYRRWIIDGLRTPNGVIRLAAWRLGTRWVTTAWLAGEFCDKVLSGHQPQDPVGTAA